MENQYYASLARQIITVNYTERTPATRAGGTLSAADYHFDVTIDQGERQHVRVGVLSEVSTAIERWAADPDNIDRIGRGGDAHELLIDLCIARILEAIDRGIDFDEDLRASPNGFLVIREAPAPIRKVASVAMDDAIAGYVAQRLYAAYRACRGSSRLECAQLFERPDWFYLKAGEPDLRRVIELYEGDRWTVEQEGYLYLKWTDSLIRELRDAERAAVKASSSNPQGDRLPLSPPTSRGADGNERPLSAHPVREWLLGYNANRWLQKEEARHGYVWRLVGFIVVILLTVAGIIVGILAL